MSLPKTLSTLFAAVTLCCAPQAQGQHWANAGETPLKIADSEIMAFGKLYPMNARPTQPLNGRAIEATQ